MELAPGVPVLFAVPVLVVAFLWAATALGYRFLKVLALPAHLLSPEERGFVCATIGAGFLQLLPLGMSAFRLLSVVNLRLATGGLAVLLLPDIIHVGRRVA